MSPFSHFTSPALSSLTSSHRSLLEYCTVMVATDRFPLTEPLNTNSRSLGALLWIEAKVRAVKSMRFSFKRESQQILWSSKRQGHLIPYCWINIYFTEGRIEFGGEAFMRWALRERAATHPSPSKENEEHVTLRIYSVTGN